jgi:hypothetical protein
MIKRKITTGLIIVFIFTLFFVIIDKQYGIFTLPYILGFVFVYGVPISLLVDYVLSKFKWGPTPRFYLSLVLHFFSGLFLTSPRNQIPFNTIMIVAAILFFIIDNILRVLIKRRESNT